MNGIALIVEAGVWENTRKDIIMVSVFFKGLH